MRCDAEFCGVVHIEGADLHLYDHAFVKDGRVDRLISVLLRKRDIILKARYERIKFSMDDAKSQIAIHRLLHDDADSQKIKHLLDRNSFALHL